MSLGKLWTTKPPQLPGGGLPPAPDITDAYVQQAKIWQRLQGGPAGGSQNLLSTSAASQPISVANKTLLGS